MNNLENNTVTTIKLCAFVPLCLCALFLTPAQSATKVSVGINGGVFGPISDKVVLNTFSNDFYFSGYAGIESEDGIEIQGSFGTYSDTSHHVDDIGLDRKIYITPLKANLIYNFFSNEDIHPYVGAGLGAYFYKHEDALFSNLESGTVFGYNFLAGLKMFFTNYIYVNAQVEKCFLPPIPLTVLSDSKDFDSMVFTIGVGMVTNFIKVGKHNVTQVGEYVYTKEQEKLLVEIQQAQAELKEMKTKSSQIDVELDNFYLRDLNEVSPVLKEKYEQITYLENKQKRLDEQISQAQARLNAFKVQWSKSQNDMRPVEEHITYLQNNYSYSPYGLRYNNGYFGYGRVPYQPQYSQYLEPVYPPVYYSPPATGGSGVTIVDREELLNKKREYLLNLKNRRVPTPNASAPPVSAPQVLP